MKSNKTQKRILLLDDNILNTTLVERRLIKSNLNFKIDRALNGFEAIRMIEDKGDKDYYDFVLADLEMPKMNGVEFIKEIREDLSISKNDLPIIVYSIEENKKIIEEVIDAGANDYYSKGVDLRVIARAVSKWVLAKYIPKKNVHNQPIIVDRNTMNNINIIIINDQEITLKLFAKQFLNVGANIEQCLDGSKAVELVIKDPIKYHLIITDINMNGLGGIRVANKIRQVQNQYNRENNTNYKIPIIAITADSDRESIFKILNNNIDDYIIKGESAKDTVRLSKFWIDYKVNIDGVCKVDNKDQFRRRAIETGKLG